MVFQSYALYPHMTVFDNMAFGLKLRRTPSEEIQRRVNTGAELLGIEDLLDRRPRQLSGGQRQRVAVGRAIVREPEVFLMDEPLSNLDAKLRVQARAEIVKIHRRLATTFIYVTHDQVEAMTMGSRIAVLKDGILQQIDTPQNLYEQPDNVFVGGFIGSPAMNFFNCTVVDVNGELKVDVGPFKIQVPSEKMAALGPYKEKKVVMGIRPEDIHDPDYVPAKVKEQTVPTHVEVTELMGNEVFLNLSTEGLEYVARVDPRTSAKMGVDMSVVMNVDNVHIFDAETEEAIR
jgi:multiple sugar transport system ATP-binding protein